MHINDIVEVSDRVSRMEGTVLEVKDSLNGVKGFLERGGQERTQNHTLIIERLTRLEVGQTQLKENVEKYQKDCDDDRKDMNDDIEEVKRVQSNASARTGTIAACISSFIAVIAIGVDYIKRG